MITNEKKENMINEVVKRLGIKKTKIYPSKTNPIVPDDYNSLKGQIEENKKLKFEGLKLDNIRIVKDKEEIIAENCTFIDFQFRDFTCEKVVFINCMFVDFSLIGGTYPNIIFIACHFERLDVRNSCVSSLVDLTGMTMIRCSFGDGCRITGANISSSRWLETDINDLEIVRDLNSPQKCIINDYFGDDFRDKSEVEADVAETIKNIDINLLEKEIIRSKIYENEEVDIRMFINTDLFNCKFINCIFVSNDFEEAGLINYEMRLSIIKTHFYKCVFSCSLKGILFDGCKFEYPEFKGQLTYSTFDTCEFVDSTVTGSAIFSHTNFIDCNLSNLGSIIFGESQRVEVLKICQTVDTIKSTEEMEEEVDKLTKEKNEAFEESSRLKNEIIAMTERVEEFEKLQSELMQLKEEKSLIVNEREMKEQEINDLNEMIKNLKSFYDEQLNEVKKMQRSADENNSVAEEYDILVQIIQLIKDKTEVLNKFTRPAELSDEKVTSFLASLEEKERMDIFTKAALERMKTVMSDGTSSIYKEDDD